MAKKGKGINLLYICPTPIGNLEDITLRVLRVLKEVDLIACEDTRHTLRLLRHFDIQKPLISYHQHNEAHATEKIINLLKEGKAIALVSDAGMPGISDPGERIISKLITEGLSFSVLPGASAVVTAIVGSGLGTTPFLYAGFIPSKLKDKKALLDSYANLEATLVFYEAPHRLLKTLEFLRDNLGNRRVVVCRELSKIYEEYVRGSIEEVIDEFSNREPRGEMAIVVEGGSKEIDIDPREYLDKLIASGMDKRDAIKKVSKELNLPKRDIYDMAHKD